MDKNPLTYVFRKGREIESVFDDLAALRIAVFRDYPYLYEGTVDYEKQYLTTYAASERAFLFAVYDGAKMVGATTCIPLADETTEVRKPFENSEFSVGEVFYFGESILLSQYRGMGLGHRFFDEREAHARSFGTFKFTCFCSVDRGENHIAKPKNYRPNDIFWLKRGYAKDTSLQSQMEWPDIGESESSSKTMTFWIRRLV
jgi:GNAT superfamily N-acetyltransferase